MERHITMMKQADKKKQKSGRKLKAKNEMPIKPDGNESKNCSNDTNNDVDTMLVDSAFVQSILKQKEKSKNPNVDIKRCIEKDYSNEIDDIHNSDIDRTSLPDDLQGFTTVRKDKAGNKLAHEKTPEGYRKKGYDLILSREKLLAVHYLSKAIEFDTTDTRHYINRSYCYLNTGEYSRALNDIHRILAHIDDPIKLNKMKCREAQALWGMQNYDAAAECFEESLNFKPNCAAVRCERMRMVVHQLTSMGFPEREVLKLLHDNHDIKIKDAVTFLCEFESGRLENNDRVNNSVDDELFQSDSDDNPSNTRMFMNIIGFDYENEDESWYENSRAEKIVDDAQWRIRSRQTTRNDMKIINAAAGSKPLTEKSGRSTDEKSVWVGNIVPGITETILAKHFSKFGKISSIYIRSRYAFVNFLQSSSAQKAIEVQTIKIGDAELPIKSVTLAK